MKNKDRWKMPKFSGWWWLVVAGLVLYMIVQAVRWLS